MMKEFYKAHDVESRLDRLTPGMLWDQTNKKAPKLRSKAAEARCLVPFAKEMAMKLLDPTDIDEEAMIQASIRLDRCYTCLSSTSFNAADLKQASAEFCALYVALSNRSDGAHWRVKPKFHLMQELCEMCPTGARPSSCWTYRDEDFGGYLAQTGAKRGGPASPGAQAKSILIRFAAKHSVPVIC